MEYYRVDLVNLAPNAIANLSVFVYICEAYLGILPNLELYRYYYKMARSGRSLESPGECTLCLYDGKADEYIRMFPKSSWSSWKKGWFYMTVTTDDRLCFAGKKAVETPE